jgi:hypothetical protein
VSKPATMIVVITSLTEPFGPYFRKTAEMSDDLPAENMGELLAQTVNEAWRAGLDPVLDMNVSIHFR